jgi:hypothetical protein
MSWTEMSIGSETAMLSGRTGLTRSVLAFVGDGKLAGVVTIGNFGLAGGDNVMIGVAAGEIDNFFTAGTAGAVVPSLCRCGDGLGGWEPADGKLISKSRGRAPLVAGAGKVVAGAGKVVASSRNGFGPSITSVGAASSQAGCDSFWGEIAGSIAGPQLPCGPQLAPGGQVPGLQRPPSGGHSRQHVVLRP